MILTKLLSQKIIGRIINRLPLTVYQIKFNEIQS